MQKQPSRGTLMKRAPKNTTKSTGEHPRQSETPKKLPHSLFKLHSNASVPPQTNLPLPYPLPPRGKKNILHKSTPKELHLHIFKNPN